MTETVGYLRVGDEDDWPVHWTVTTFASTGFSGLGEVWSVTVVDEGERVRRILWRDCQ